MNRKAIIVTGFFIVGIPLCLLFIAHTKYLLNNPEVFNVLLGSIELQDPYVETHPGTFLTLYCAEILLLIVIFKLAYKFFIKGEQKGKDYQ